MSPYPDSTAPAVPVPATAPAPLRARLAELRGPVAPRPLDARALAALATNPGCRRRAILDAAGVDKSAVASRIGRPAPFGQSQFAIARGHAFEARVTADRCAELLRLLGERLGVPVPGEVDLPDLDAAGPAGRTERTRLALAEATTAGRWALLEHPMLRLDVAGSPVHLEPDAVVVHPDGTWTVVEVKSFPILDGSADPSKVGAAARQAAVYVLALEEAARSTGRGRPGETVLLVCPRDFSNLPTASPVDVRKQLSVTRRQLARLTRIEEIAAALPEGTTFDLRPAEDGRTPTRPPRELAAAVDSVPAAYSPECLSTCELAFHCRERARQCGAVQALGRAVRGELGGLTTVEQVLAAARGPVDPDDPAARRLHRAARLRAEALAGAPAGADPAERPGAAEHAPGGAAAPGGRGREAVACR
ncbi:hypothetical protein ACFV1B_02750 [Streptomyces sp. NPDC059637]|uniref:hypothetical protein n=1 Tax=Streptomyces sp. NPDC059637 TaxID=3347752 RepID=UPI00369E6BC2